ncbi:hypothetical protein C0Q70_08925 [Pomacea canaliculata]|uniref:RCC1 domain-containing protein 1 n=1 Tax=Pomacea canaliculata TaxID=400727 RepID=A0A2T7P8C0_POMCA|nr:hypothetical protein C0Q70_08925 [Pomacea canaliculata]
MLRQLSYFNAEENDTKSQTKYLNSSECVAENEHDKVTPVKVNVKDDLLQKHGRTTELYPLAADKKKEADKWDELNEDCCRRVHHTVVAGYSGGLKTLQLHLSNIELLGSTVYDVLLKSNEKYLLLPEAHTEILPISIMPAEKSESSADYNGISVGVLTSDNIKCDAKEAADGTLQLKLTPIDSGLSIQHVSCGLEHTVLLSQHGGIFTFGCGSRGQLGHGALESESQPRMVEDLEGMRCVCVAAGGWHSAAISIDGDLYMWGWNESGQLGLPSPAIQQKKCKQMQEDEQREEHQHGCSLHLCPEYVPIGSESIILVAAACGTRHTAVLSGCGKVFTAGWNRYGQLGHHHANNMDKFLPVHFSDIETTVQQVWCGAWNTAFLLTDIKS